MAHIMTTCHRTVVPALLLGAMMLVLPRAQGSASRCDVNEPGVAQLVANKVHDRMVNELISPGDNEASSFSGEVVGDSIAITGTIAVRNESGVMTPLRQDYTPAQNQHDAEWMPDWTQFRRPGLLAVADIYELSGECHAHVGYSLKPMRPANARRWFENAFAVALDLEGLRSRYPTRPTAASAR